MLVLQSSLTYLLLVSPYLLVSPRWLEDGEERSNVTRSVS